MTPADLVLDCRGKRCPLPVIELARRIVDVPVGGVVEVLSDDPAAAVDVPAWCRMRGQEYLGELPGADGTPAYRVRRVQGSARVVSGRRDPAGGAARRRAR